MKLVIWDICVSMYQLNSNTWNWGPAGKYMKLKNWFRIPDYLLLMLPKLPNPVIGWIWPPQCFRWDSSHGISPWRSKCIPWQYSHLDLLQKKTWSHFFCRDVACCCCCHKLRNSAPARHRQLANGSLPRPPKRQPSPRSLPWQSWKVTVQTQGQD